ncbi:MULTISPECIES: hypothetical protein [Bacillaceae]|nr:MULTISPECIES: hypothetical protein [Bacillaceae]MCF7622402.1 hypothetical protein [Peribacillus frigoritolerans]
MKLMHLLVSLRHLLVNSILRMSFKQFPHEMEVNIRELEALLAISVIYS